MRTKDIGHSKYIPKLRPSTRFRVGIIYFTKEGARIFFEDSPPVSLNRVCLPRWLQNIELEIWHEVIVREPCQFVAITRNICIKKRVFLQMHVHDTIADIIISYLYYELKSKTKKGQKLT